MDWSHYTASDRLPNKIYEDSYVTSWALKNEDSPNVETTLEPESFEVGQEKSRIIECVNSNKYNITQTLAETFGVFCVYEYKCDNRGQFIGSYYDEVTQEAWTGKKVIFYNRAIKTEHPLFVDYQKNLASISRSADSTELYTKLYVTPIQSEFLDTGYISIADTDLNPLLDDFILNFDYLYNKGSITDYQYSYVNKYRVELYGINNDLREASPSIETLNIEINDLKAKLAATDKEIESTKETLDSYQTLRNSDVTNMEITRDADNAYSVAFSADQDCYAAKFRLEGIDPNTIKGYSDYKYLTPVFSEELGNLIISQSSQRLALNSNNPNFYITLDDYGFPSEIYTSLGNPTFAEGNSRVIYLELTYSPSNAYTQICDILQEHLAKKQHEKASLEQLLGRDDGEKSTGKYKDLFEKEEAYNKLLADKEELNRKFELVMGPALREGYWTPEAYADPGQTVEKYDLTQFKDKPVELEVELIYDSNYLEGEDDGHYTDAVFEGELKHYSYLCIADDENLLSSSQLNDLVIHLVNPSSYYQITGQPLKSGPYKFLYNSKWYSFITPNDYEVNTMLEIRNNNGSLVVIVNDSTILSVSAGELDDAIDLTNRFEGLNNYLGERLLYNNAGFVFAFIKQKSKTEIEPVILFNNNDINYSKYNDLYYTFTAGNSHEFINSTIYDDDYTLYYPRIIISSKNVNYKSDLFTLETYGGDYQEELATKLTKYEDYSIVLKGAKPHITLKINNHNRLIDIIQNKYHIIYQISRSNEMLFLDAQNVARENSQPKYSYDLKLANIPGESSFVELGQLVYINDHALGVHAATGYVSGIKLALDKPQDDELTIQNYKTKFEDLFSVITASSEAMKNNAVAYNIAAAGFTPNGQIDGSVLQDSLNSNSVAFNYSNTNVQIDDTEGIILTNTQPYLNGVYGQVALRGGGIFLSNMIDNNGNRVWNTGITPNGINASVLDSGIINTESIRIFSGNNMAFQWNAEGIFAYYRDDNGMPNMSKYVHYSDQGLQYIDNEQIAVDLGWNGLLISTQDGTTELTGKYGLTIYDGLKKYKENATEPYNHVVRLGRIDDDYGLKLYKHDGQGKYVENLVMTNGGELWLKDILTVGTKASITWTEEDGTPASGECVAGIVGNDNSGDPATSVRFWAGRDADHMQIAPFRVLQDGTLIAKQANITGTINATDGFFKGNIEATTGTIGGWTIDTDKLTTTGITLQAANEETGTKASIVVRGNDPGKSVEILGDGTFRAEGVSISGEITAVSGSIGGLTVQQISGDTSLITVSVVSSNGNISYYNTEFSTTLTAMASIGNVPLTAEDYDDYSYNWQASSDGVQWESLENGNARTFEYTATLQSGLYIRCKMERVAEEEE